MKDTKQHQQVKKDARQTNTTHNGKTESSDNAYRGFGLSIPNTEQTAPTPSQSIFSKKMMTLDLSFSTQYQKMPGKPSWLCRTVCELRNFLTVYVCTNTVKMLHPYIHMDIIQTCKSFRKQSYQNKYTTEAAKDIVACTITQSMYTRTDTENAVCTKIKRRTLEKLD